MTPTIANLAETAALLGEPARTAMLCAMLDGRAFTAGELAGAAGVMPSTASGHLSLLLEARMVVVHKQGRHRYYRLAGPEIASAIEGLLCVTEQRRDGVRVAQRSSLATGPKDLALRDARLCYDHLAGRLGVAVFGAMVDRQQLHLADGGVELTLAGERFFAELGLFAALEPRGGSRAPQCRPCLDWSERRPHLAGRAGAALCAHAIERGWVRRLAQSRAVVVTAGGHRALTRHFGIEG